MGYDVSDAAREAVARLTAREDVRRALSLAREDEPRCIQEQICLTKVESPTFHEQDRAVAFAQMMREAGLTHTRIDRGGNVTALRRGTGGGPRILLEAHMDTVFQQGSVTGVTEKDGRLYAPGVSDDTRGLAVLLSVARALDAAGIATRGDLLFAGTTREEGIGGMGGMKDLIDDLPEAPDACISVDSGSMQGIIYEATGMRTMEVRFHGVGGHAFGAFGQAAQPLHAAARAVAKIADLPVPADPRTTYCVSGFHAGSDAGIHAIPPLAVIKVNYRSNSPEQLEKLDKAIFGAIQAACDEETARWGRDRITWDAKQYIDIPAGTQDPHSLVVESLYAALAEVEVTPRLLRGGATNSSIAIARGLPAVCMGTAWHPEGQEISTMDHTLAEFFPVAGAYKGVQAALLTVLLCSGTQDTPSLLKR